MALLERPHPQVLVRARAQTLEYESIAARIARDRPQAVLDWGFGFGQVTDLLARAGLPRHGVRLRAGARFGRAAPARALPAARGAPEPRPGPPAVRRRQLRRRAELRRARARRPSRRFARRDPPRAARGRVALRLQAPNRFSYLERIARLLGLYFHGRLPDDAVYSLRSARSLLEAHGYEVRELRRANMLPLTLSGAFAPASRRCSGARTGAGAGPAPERRRDQHRPGRGASALARAGRCASASSTTASFRTPSAEPSAGIATSPSGSTPTDTRSPTSR
jgi:hypothetical protein